MPETTPKSPGSSPLEKQVQGKAVSISSSPLTDEERAELQQLSDLPDSEIDYSDIPELTEEQLARFRPARDFEQFRRWQDQHASPEQIALSEESRRQWHARHPEIKD